jgi:hypothetical protein
MRTDREIFFRKYYLFVARIVSNLSCNIDWPFLALTLNIEHK